MTATAATIYVVDDDPDLSATVAEYLRARGRQVVSFSSGEEFLAADVGAGPGCLLTDLRMPGLSGQDLQRHVRDRGAPLAVVVMTAHADVRTAIEIMKDGASDIFEKSRPLKELESIIDIACAKATSQWHASVGQSAFEERRSSLTAREREVLDLVVAGNANKEIAVTLGISINTVEIHRSRVMKKMAADSIAELVTMVLKGRSGPGTVP